MTSEEKTYARAEMVIQLAAAQMIANGKDAERVSADELGYFCEVVDAVLEFSDESEAPQW